MNEETIKELKEKLEEEKGRLEKSLNKIATKDKNLEDDYDAKFVDYGNEVFDESAEASEVSEYDRKLSIEGNLEVRLREVNHALDRINTKKYGICDDCGEKINEKRLMADPAAKLCINCSSKEE